MHDTLTQPITEELSPCHIVGRNGNTDLGALSLDVYADCADLFGVSRSRGIIVNGGFMNVPLADLDELCKKYLAQRGYRVIPQSIKLALLYIDDGDGFNYGAYKTEEEADKALVEFLTDRLGSLAEDVELTGDTQEDLDALTECINTTYQMDVFGVEVQ